MKGPGFAVLSATQSHIKWVSTSEISLWALWSSLCQDLCSSPVLTPPSSNPKITDCQLSFPWGRYKILPLPTELTPPRWGPLGISYGTPKTPDLQLPDSAPSTPKGWNGGVGARAITSAWSTKAKQTVKALHQLMAQAVPPSLSSSQGIFGTQESGWYFSFK